MAVVDLAALTSPVSDEEPCGPDLELAGDADYMNFMARADGVIPTSYFSGPDGKPFDRTSVDFPAEFEAIKPLLARTHDVRLITILAKMLILNRDLEGFETCVGAISTLLEGRWDDVHPRGEDGIFAVRIAAIETLDDMPPVIMPLQHLPIAESRRFGSVSYRSYMIASGDVKPREGEEAFELNAVEQALMETELSQLVGTCARFDKLRKALANIRTVCMDRSSGEMVKLERLPPFVEKVFALLNDVVTKRDPSAALPTEADAAQPAAEAGPATTIAAGLIRSPADAAAGLAAVADYFSRFEPSNPALLLVRQAEQLMGKSFLEVIRILVPTHVDQAAILLGKDQMVELPLERLSAFAEVNPSSTAAWATPSTGTESADAESEAAETTTDGSEGGEAPSAEAGDAPRPRPPNGGGGGGPARRIVVQTRRDAIAVLDQIGIYYRGAEPSSPVPCIVERARSLAERDFLSLLKDLLPEAAFKSPTG
jgi:type VI secretion system protein ImpA